MGGQSNRKQGRVKEAYLINYNGEPHGLRRRPDQKDDTVRMQEFFDYLLKDAPKPGMDGEGIPYIEGEQEKEKHNAVCGGGCEEVRVMSRQLGASY
jgi:hypothetical protein